MFNDFTAIFFRKLQNFLRIARVLSKILEKNILVFFSGHSVLVTFLYSSLMAYAHLLLKPAGERYERVVGVFVM